MKLSLAIEYKKLPADIKSPEALSRFLITEAVSRKFPQGMPRTESRMYGRLLDEFYREAETIEIDESTFLLIKESLDQAVLPAHMSSWRWSLADHLEAAVAKKKE